jgi:AraC-like DNA-binding protein
VAGRTGVARVTTGNAFRARVLIRDMTPADDLTTIFQRLRWSVVDYGRHALASGGSRREDGDGVRFHFVAEGTATLRCETTSLLLNTGDFLLLPRGGAHSIVATGPGAVLHTGQFDFSTPEAAAVIAAMPATVVACCIAAKEPMVALLMDGIAAEANGSRPGASSVISQLAGAVAMAAIRLWIESGCGSARLLSAPLHDSDVSRALSAIHDEPGTPWTVDRLARVALASRSAFSKRFRDAVGESPARYLAQVRMEQAKYLLGEYTTVAEVAVRLGYGSEAAFSRAFRRHAGVPPTQWRDTGSLTPGGH